MSCNNPYLITFTGSELAGLGQHGYAWDPGAGAGGGSITTYLRTRDAERFRGTVDLAPVLGAGLGGISACKARLVITAFGIKSFSSGDVVSDSLGTLYDSGIIQIPASGAAIAEFGARYRYLQFVLTMRSYDLADVQQFTPGALGVYNAVSTIRIFPAPSPTGELP